MIDKYVNSKKIIGSIIKLNRINKNISQKQLSKGICVPSYLSRIENGELLPSEDVISVIFDRLGLKFYDSDEFLLKGKKYLNDFFTNLNYNEFDYTNKLFDNLEKDEDKYIASPLILDYFLAKLARYSSTPNRDKFEYSKNMILSSFDLLTAKQKYIYNFYAGIDILILSNNKIHGKQFIQEALSLKETGHCYFWLSYAYRIENNPIKAYDSINKALDLYVAEGNIISIMSSYEKIAEVYFMLDNYSDAINYLEISLNMAKKFKNIYFLEHLNSILAWAYYRLNDFNKALEYLSYNKGLIDHRLIIPDSVIESLIYFSLENKELLNKAILNLNNPKTIQHIGEHNSKLIYDLFKLFIEDNNYNKNPLWGNLLSEINTNITKLVELKKVFNELLKNYYIINRRYKDALFL